MVELLKSLAGTPIPTILIVAGLLFLLLAIADKVHGELKVSPQNRKYALGAGLLLLLGGLAIEIALPRIAPPEAPETQASSGAPAGEWRTWAFHAGAHPSIDCLRYRLYAQANSDPWTDVLCMDKALAEADLAMGDNYKAFRNSRAPDQIAVVKQAQRDWVKQRNLACPANWTDLATYAKVEMIADCLRAETATRTQFFIEAMTAE